MQGPSTHMDHNGEGKKKGVPSNRANTRFFASEPASVHVRKKPAVQDGKPSGGHASWMRHHHRSYGPHGGRGGGG